MTEVMYRKSTWAEWVSIWCVSRSAALSQRNWLRARGYHAEVI